MKNNDTKYRFSWKLLGDTKTGRPHLGPLMRVEIYRLMQYTLRDILEEDFGQEKTDAIVFRAGYRAGTEFYRNLMGKPASINEFVHKLQQVMGELKMGILRVEKADPQNGVFIMTVSEDLDCSGLPETGYGVCTFDEGFIAGLMESFTGEQWDVREIDCWCTGDRTCRFSVTRKNPPDPVQV